MAAKHHTHKVNISDRRRTNKKLTDIHKKSVLKKDVQEIFDTYYKNQLRALYRAVNGDK